eukprot:scaffold85517_cov32-Tisochrysis_lutea.AAC.3
MPVHVPRPESARQPANAAAIRQSSSLFVCAPTKLDGSSPVNLADDAVEPPAEVRPSGPVSSKRSTLRKVAMAASRLVRARRVRPASSIEHIRNTSSRRSTAVMSRACATWSTMRQIHESTSCSVRTGVPCARSGQHKAS